MLDAPAVDAARVRAIAGEIGFDRVAFANADVAVDALSFLTRWLAEGNAADMARWLSRAPERRADPSAFLPGALGVISLGVGYRKGALPPPPDAPAGRVARYAWGADYHEAIERRLALLQEALAREFPGLASRPAVDAQPLLERAFARRAGLGFIGKNTNLIAPGAGSWLFLTELVVNVPLPPDPPVAQGCGGCRECQTGCPTGALDIPFSLDARLCVSYQTIENRASIPTEMRPKLGGWLFGCDDCQEVCPFNARPLEASWPEFSAERGAGPWLPLAEVLAMRSDADFKKRFAGTPILRAKRAGLVRNACVVARNRGAAGELKALLEECRDADESPVVREHAAWALA
jgi:epoxyqueuosine reductase